jgi:hypothetical protein
MDNYLKESLKKKIEIANLATRADTLKGAAQHRIIPSLRAGITRCVYHPLIVRREAPHNQRIQRTVFNTRKRVFHPPLIRSALARNNYNDR